MDRVTGRHWKRSGWPKIVLIPSAALYALVATVSAASGSNFDPNLAQDLQAALDSTVAVDDIIEASAAVILPDEGLWLGASGMTRSRDWLWSRAAS
jgi:hypothetical protein